MCRRMLVAAVVVFAGCNPANQDDLRPLVAAAGYYSLMQGAVPGPAPAPAPKPGPVQCRNCRGLGYLTDGTVRTLCPVCKGNKVTSCPDGNCPLATTAR